MSGEVQDNQGFYDPMVEYVEQLGHEKCIVWFMKGCHDPMATPVEKLYNGNDGMFMHSESQRFKNGPPIIPPHITTLYQAGGKNLQM